MEQKITCEQTEKGSVTGLTLSNWVRPKEKEKSVIQYVGSFNLSDHYSSSSTWEQNENKYDEESASASEPWRFNSGMSASVKTKPKFWEKSGCGRHPKLLLTIMQLL